LLRFDGFVRFDSNKYRRPTPQNQQRGLDLLGEALYAARIDRFSQQELALRTGISQSTISRLERGLAPGVSVRRLGALILVLGGVTIGVPARRNR
jgi:hypothetical protein